MVGLLNRHYQAGAEALSQPTAAPAVQASAGTS